MSLDSSLTFFAPDSIVKIVRFPVGGVSAGAIITHYGRLPWYLRPYIFGFFHVQGGNYSTVGATVAGDVQRLDDVPDGTLLDKAVVSPICLSSVTRVLYSQPRGSLLFIVRRLSCGLLGAPRRLSVLPTY